MATFDQIAVGYDHSERGEDALRLGAELAQTSGGALRVVRVETDPTGGGEQDAVLRVEREARAALPDPAPAVQAVVLRADSPARALHELAADGRADLIVLGSTHRAGIGRVLPGGAADRLLSGAPCPVAIAPRGYEPDQLRVLAVGFDGSAEAEAAVTLAGAIGLEAEATLRVIAVQEAPVSAGAARAEAIAAMQDLPDLQERLQEVVRDLDPALRALPVFERGNPAVVLVERAEEGVDLLAMGSRGYGPVRAVLLGSVSSHVARRASCPIVITPRAAAG